MNYIFNSKLILIILYSLTLKMSAQLVVSEISIEGRFRSLKAKIISHQKNNATLFQEQKPVIVMIPGFMENSYWFDIQLDQYSLSQSFLNDGYDVVLLSFITEKKSENEQKKYLGDYSYHEVIQSLLPETYQLLKDLGFQKFTWIAHSYGASIISSFLLGLEKNKLGQLEINQELKLDRQNHTESVIYLAGLFKLYWPIDYMELYKEIGKENFDWYQSNPFLQLLIEKTPLKLIEFLKPTLEFSILKLMNPSLLGFIRFFIDQKYFSQFNPIYYSPNTQYEALHLAIQNGVSSETIETTATIASSYFQPHRLEFSASKALIQLPHWLPQIKVPAFFITGDKDLITHQQGVYQFGFLKIGSSEKKWLTLPQFGHQDLFLSKNPHLLKSALRQWMSR